MDKELIFPLWALENGEAFLNPYTINIFYDRRKLNEKKLKLKKVEKWLIHKTDVYHCYRNNNLVLRVIFLNEKLTSQMLTRCQMIYIDKDLDEVLREEVLEPLCNLSTIPNLF